MYFLSTCSNNNYITHKPVILDPMHNNSCCQKQLASVLTPKMDSKDNTPCPACNVQE